MANKMTKKEVLSAIVSALKAGDTAIVPEDKEDDDGNGIQVDREVLVFDVTPEVRDEVIAYALNEIDLLNKKRANAATKLSKTQKENSTIKEKILAILKGFDKPVRINDIIKKGAEQDANTFQEMSPQKASALLKQLTESGQVARYMDKKVATFAAIVDEEDSNVDEEDSDTDDPADSE